MKKRIESATHYIRAVGPNGTIGRHPDFGKADLYKILSEMMRDGYTDFVINTVKN